MFRQASSIPAGRLAIRSATTAGEAPAWVGLLPIAGLFGNELPTLFSHRAQAEVLRSIGCQYGQGHWLAPPESPERITERLNSPDRVW